MIYTFQLFLDVIFPPTDNELALRGVCTADFLQNYRPGKSLGVYHTSDYHLPLVKAAITGCKFEHNYYAAKLLGTLANKHLSTLPNKTTLFIPIPLSKKRQHSRGYNQVEEVLLQIGKLPYEYKISTNILRRTRDTKAQTSLTQSERKLNIKGAFSINPSAVTLLNSYERIIVCDDVLTTGATINEARATLAPHLPKQTELICLAWAH